MMVRVASVSILVLFCLNAFVPVAAQEAKTVRKRVAGVRHASGRVVRFVPKHEKIRKQQEEQTDTILAESFQQTATVDPDQEELIEQASYLEEEPIFPDACSDCDVCGGTCTADCGPQVRATTRIDFLLFSTKGMNSPALATSSPGGTARDDAGVLGQDSTSTLFGGRLNEDVRSGVRLTLGLHLECLENNGLEISYMILDDERESFFDSNLNRPILARPFFNTTLNAEDSRLIAYPSLVAGTLAIESTTKFHTADIAKQFPRSLCGLKTAPFIGYRYAKLEDDLVVRESTISLDAPTLDTLFDLQDQFETENTFHGGQIGFRFTRQCNPCWSFELLTKTAIGNTKSRAAVSGQTVTSPPNIDPITISSGLLALDSNSGTFEQDKFSTIWDVSVTIRRHTPCGLTTSLGYSFLYWSDVWRATEQIDRSINQTQIPPTVPSGELRPVFPLATSELWAQGLQLGLEYRW